MKLHQFILACALAVTTAASAQENCGFPVSLLKSGFEAGEQPSMVQLPPDTTPLTFTVDYPANNITIGTDTIQVYGSYTGPSNTGFTVNGAAIVTTAQNFASFAVPLTVGANTITFVGSTIDGSPQTVTRTVTYDPNQAPEVRFLSVASGDFAPARMGFTLTYSLPASQTTLTRVQIDFNGDGTDEIDASTIPASLIYAFESGGFFTATAKLTFDDSNVATPLVVKTSSSKIAMQTMAYTRQTLCAVYYGMKHRLEPGQSGVTAALRTLTTALRPEFQTIWMDLGANLSATANQLGEVVDGQISDTMAEFQVAVPDPAVPGEFFGFPVAFRRGEDGVWRISEM